jgi:hypothetical protein
MISSASVRARLGDRRQVEFTMPDSFKCERLMKINDLLVFLI